MKSILLVLTFLITSNLFAGVLIEPYLGYRTGSTEQTIDGTKYEKDLSGHVIGARLGYGFMGLSFGLQYEIGAVEYEQTKPTSAPGTDYDTTALGAFIGFGVPLFRVWGTYFFSADSEVSKNNPAEEDVKGDEANGKGFALGAGFTGLPFLALNLEYRMITIDEVSSSGTTYALPIQGNSEVDVKEIIFSVSVPLDL
jgi:hypothetical protein